MEPSATPIPATGGGRPAAPPAGAAASLPPTPAANGASVSDAPAASVWPEGAARAAEAAQHLNLTDFLELRTLQEVQDSFTALTRMSTTIRDAQGRPVTVPSDGYAAADAQRALDWLVVSPPGVADAGGGAELIAPIKVEGQTVGSIAVRRGPRNVTTPAGRERFRTRARALGLPEANLEQMVAAAEELSGPPGPAAGVQFVHLMANSIARLCYQEYQLRRRVEQLSTLYELSTVLSAHRDVQQVIDTAARSAAQAMGVKAAMIRLLDDTGALLVPRATYNISQAYLDKGPIDAQRSEIFRQALAGEVVYINDLASDPRVFYPDDARREGLASYLCAALVFRGEPIGILQLYTAQPRPFSPDEIALARAVGQILATAIQHARLDAQRQEAQRVQRQLTMAADVQKRMFPREIPRLEPFDIAARYVPSFELSGDFYDMIDLQGNLGLAVADVAGKGIAASLVMASVRSSLRAFAQDVYDIDQIMARVNIALCRDTLANEFATLFYGVLDPRTRRFTYCNAGHEPPLLLRRGEFTRLEAGGMIVGVDPLQKYDKGLLDLLPGDFLLLYTDGLADALNFDQQRFGRARIMQAMRDASEKTAADAVNHILWEMRRFAGFNPRSDDTTLVAVKVKG